MPELPEVETVRRSLNRLVRGKRFESLCVFYPPMSRVPEALLQKTLKHKTLEDISRRGKTLLFAFEDERLLVHLRMEGKFHLRTLAHERTKHEHWMMAFTDDTALWYHDVRKFGTLDLRRADTVFETQPLSRLGPEPDDPSLDVDYLRRRMRSERTVKAVLLDQSVIAGIGNIYADEILFCAGIDPNRPAKRLKRTQCEKLLACTRDILKEAVALGGASVHTYRDTLGIDGRFQTRLKVHLRAGKPCPVCHEAIEKIRVAGRGTYRCRRCQH